MKKFKKYVFVLATLTLICITIASTILAVSAEESSVIPNGINVSGYANEINYLSKISKCIEEGTENSLMMGAIYETQRNLKVSSENLPYEQTHIFTSLNRDTVKNNYDALFNKSTPESESPSMTYIGYYKLSFYCSCSKCCGKSDGITATGTKVSEGRTIAVDPSKIPLGSKVYIEGWGYYTAEDTGGAIKSNRIDVYVASHSRALKYGIKYANVYIVK